MDGARGILWKKNHNGLLFTTISYEYIWPKIFWFSCLGKKVPFWQFFRIFKSCQNGIASFPKIFQITHQKCFISLQNDERIECWSVGRCHHIHFICLYNGFSVFFPVLPSIASFPDLRYQPRNVLLVCRMMRAVPYILGELNINTASVGWKKNYPEEMVHLTKFLLIPITFRQHFLYGEKLSEWAEILWGFTKF